MTEGVSEKWEDAKSAASRLTGIFLIAGNATISKKKKERSQKNKKRTNQEKVFAKFAESRQEGIRCATNILR